MKQKMSMEMTGCCGQKAFTLHLSGAHLRSTAHGETRPSLVGWSTVSPALMEVSDSLSFSTWWLIHVDKSCMPLLFIFVGSDKKRCELTLLSSLWTFSLLFSRGKVGHRRWWCSCSFHQSCFQQLMPALIKPLTCRTRFLFAFLWALLKAILQNENLLI